MARRGPLLGLSREHHAALVLARDCRRVTDADAVALRERIHAHHRAVLVDHFAIEEALLATHAVAIPQAMHARLQVDHAWLRAWVQAGSVNVADIVAYGAHLNAHVRFEEREVWPLLQPLVMTPDGDA